MTIVKFTSSNISLSENNTVLFISHLLLSKERVTASRKSLTYNIYTHTNFARLALAHTVTEASHIGSWTWEVLLFRKLKCTEVQQVDCARPARGIGLKQQWLVGTSRSDCARDSAAWNVYSSQTKLGQRFRVCDRLGLGQQTQSLTHCTSCNGTQAEDDYPGPSLLQRKHRQRCHPTGLIPKTTASSFSQCLVFLSHHEASPTFSRACSPSASEPSQRIWAALRFKHAAHTSLAGDSVILLRNLFVCQCCERDAVRSQAVKKNKNQIKSNKNIHERSCNSRNVRDTFAGPSHPPPAGLYWHQAGLSIHTQLNLQQSHAGPNTKI